MFKAYAWKIETASLTLGNKCYAVPVTVIIPQSQQLTCKVTHTSNPTIYRYNGGGEGGPKTCIVSTGEFLPIWQPQWEVSLSSAAVGSRPLFYLSSLCCLQTGFKIVLAKRCDGG